MRLKFNPEAERILSATNRYLKTNEIFDATQVFGNENPVHLEIGSGKGGFILQMAILNPNINFIAVEMYPSAICKISNYQETLPINLRIMCGDITKLKEKFKHGSISKVYLNFSDPWPKGKHEKRRLTYKSKLALYQDLLILNGEIQLKTDNTSFFEYSVYAMNNYGMIFDEINIDIYRNHKFLNDNVQTEYEKKFSSRGVSIKRIKAKFR
jgi:tRNA (guanine-N7-)-methyltransferase